MRRQVRPEATLQGPTFCLISSLGIAMSWQSHISTANCILGQADLFGAPVTCPRWLWHSGQLGPQRSSHLPLCQMHGAQRLGVVLVSVQNGICICCASHSRSVSCPHVRPLQCHRPCYITSHCIALQRNADACVSMTVWQRRMLSMQSSSDGLA